LVYFYNTSSGKAKPGTRLTFLVTNRLYFEIERRLRSLTKQVQTIRLASEDGSERISEDICLFVKAKINELREG
jgi:hypothetical protein